jgi:ankyrin repeat protein
LRELDDKTTPKGIKSALKQFKKQTQGSSQDQKLKLLSSAYERTMKRINGQKDGLRQLAITVLLWITCAERPLTTSELLHAIAVEEDTLELDEDNIHRIEELVSVCAGLVTIDEESDIIRLAHYTTQEYLDQTKHDWFPDAQTRIVKSCVTYLSFDAFKTGFCSTDEEFRARLQDNAFYGYAAQNWGHHTRKAPPSVQTEEFVLQFLESDMIVAGASQAMLTFGNNSGHNRGPPRGVNGLHLTTYFNLQNYTKQLLQRGHSLEAKDSDGQTPLMWAINNGHDTLVEWLLTNEPDVNSFDTSKRTALHHSACMGQIKSMRLLMQRRAGVEARDSQGQTPLLAAVSKGQTAAVKYLLEVGADPKVFSEEKKGVLHLSIESDNASLEMVELLLAHDAPTDMIHIGNMSPLHSTIQYNRTDIASLLLENRVNIDFGIQRRDRRSLQDGYAAYELKNVNENQEFQTGGLGTLTPLHFAALVGNPKMTAYFLSRGADPNALSHYQETPLHLAISKRVQGSEYEDAWNEDCWRAEFLWDIVEDYNDEDETEAVATQVSDRRQAVIMALLEDDRTNVTLQDVQGSSVLHLIEYHKLASSHLLSPLIQKRAMLSARNLKGQTPLHLASLAGDFNSVEILINKGSDIQAADNEGKSAIHYAAERSSIPVVRLILDSYEGNLDLLALKDNNGRAALHHSLGYICVKFDVVRMLLEKGANANDMDDLGNSPLAHYLSSFQFSIDRNICLVLLECGTNARSVNRAGETLAELYTTSGKVKVEILQLLKQYDVDIAKIDSDGKSLLHRMALGGSLTEEALEYIFGNTNIYLNMTDLSGKTALQYAMEEAGRERPLFLWDGDRWSRTANILLYAT